MWRWATSTLAPGRRTAGRVWYSGSPEVTNFDHVESDPGHVLVVDIDENDPAHPVSVEAHHVGHWRFLTLHRQVDNTRDIADLDSTWT